jgi:hypothetical protein
MDISPQNLPRRASTSTADAMPCWADDPQPLETVRARTLDHAASDALALLSQPARHPPRSAEAAGAAGRRPQLDPSPTIGVWSPEARPRQAGP